MPTVYIALKHLVFIGRDMLTVESNWFLPPM